MSAAEATEEQLHAEVARLEQAIADAEREGAERLRAIDERFAPRLADAVAERDALAAEHKALVERLERMTTVAIIRPASGAQWTPPHRGKA